MNFYEAIKSRRPIRRKNRQHWRTRYGMESITDPKLDQWMDPDWYLDCVGASKQDILADDWEVKPSPMARIQKRIDGLQMHTGRRPEFLDVTPREFADIQQELASVPFAGDGRIGFGYAVLELWGVRIIPVVS